MSRVTTQAEDFPMNLLDDIARDVLHPDGCWEYEIPSDINGTLMYVLEETLTECEREVLKLRYIHKLTYSDAGNKLDVTKERIRQIEAKAFRKLRHPSRKNLLITGIKRGIEEARILDTDQELMKRLDKIRTAVEEIARASTSDPVGFCERLGEEKDKLRPLILKKPIEELELSERSYNCLKRIGIETVEDITKMSLAQLASVRNLGKRSVNEVIGKLEKYGLKLRETL